MVYFLIESTGQVKIACFPNDSPYNQGYDIF